MTTPSSHKKTPTRLRELQQQAQVVQVLRRQGIPHAAVPNGHVRTLHQRGTAALEGVLAGMPDLLVFRSPPAVPHAKGVALEMKRATARAGDVRPEQHKVLDMLRREGWVTIVGYGAADALAHLHALGYDLGYEPTSVPFPRRVAALKKEITQGGASAAA